MPKKPKRGERKVKPRNKFLGMKTRELEDELSRRGSLSYHRRVNREMAGLRAWGDHLNSQEGA
jgi:hypothetical protein